MFLLNSCLGHFSAASLQRLPLLRTYGVNLPSSLTTLLPLVLGFSPHLPVSVCGTGTFSLDSSFSRQCGLSAFGTYFSLCVTPLDQAAYFTTALPTALTRVLPATRAPSLLCPCFSHTRAGGTGISTCCPSTTPFGLALGPD